MKKKLSNEELIVFCRQMGLVLKSGISALEGIYLMEENSVSEEGKEIFREIREELEYTGLLYPAMEQCGVFPEYVLHMVEIGEQAGRLDEAMESLADYYQREEETAAAVKSAVIYPVVMLGMMVVIVAVLFIKVMPVFEQVYLQLGQEMTGVAADILNLGKWMRQSALVFGILAVLVLAGAMILSFSSKARREFVKQAEKFGLMKRIAWKRARARFANGMAMALKSGLDVDQSLEMVEKLVEYEPLREKIAVCREKTRQGGEFSEAIQESQIFQGMQARMIVIGYQTGTMDEVMDQAADLYQGELHGQIQRMIGILEPTLVGILCVIVGVILLSVMLPLMGMMAGIG